jgi:hypothetical protein
MFYDLAPDGLEKVQFNFTIHKARLEEFHARGVINGVVGKYTL